MGRRFLDAKTQGVLAILKKEVERKVLKNWKKWAKRPKIACFLNENPRHFTNFGPI